MKTPHVLDFSFSLLDLELFSESAPVYVPELPPRWSRENLRAHYVVSVIVQTLPEENGFCRSQQLLVEVVGRPTKTGSYLGVFKEDCRYISNLKDRTVMFLPKHVATIVPVQ